MFQKNSRQASIVIALAAKKNGIRTVTIIEYAIRKLTAILIVSQTDMMNGSKDKEMIMNTKINTKNSKTLKMNITKDYIGIIICIS
ncbi:hypothetical protein IKG13_00360 [Candidatus Saccharibacteria bacterium]|nr:hypothetical protein [Candidatus Saccharibacteria bacterium]MBR3378306.1 hypothetical protein [Candidatus Saccharibacteria bacterium]